MTSPEPYVRVRVPKFVVVARDRLRLSRAGLLAVVAAIGAAAGAAIVLLAVSEDVLHSDGLEVRDPSNLQVFMDHRSALLVGLARGLTQLGSVGVLVLVAVGAGVLLWFRGTRLVVAVAPLASLLTAGALAGLGKVLIARQRPPAQFRLVSESDASFPSGHSTDSTALFVTLAIVVAVVLLRRPRARIAFVAAGGLLAGLIGLSRLLLGVHWPTDVLAGWALGFGVAVTVSTVALLMNHVAADDPPAPASGHRLVIGIRRWLATDRRSLRAAPARTA